MFKSDCKCFAISVAQNNVHSKQSSIATNKDKQCVPRRVSTILRNEKLAVPIVPPRIMVFFEMVGCLFGFLFCFCFCFVFLFCFFVFC